MTNDGILQLKVGDRISCVFEPDESWIILDPPELAELALPEPELENVMKEFGSIHLGLFYVLDERTGRVEFWSRTPFAVVLLE